MGAYSSEIEKVINDTTMTVDEKNVQLVRVKRFILCTSKIPASVRRALNEAVKRGELGHVKKEGHKPEAYFHPTFDYMMKAARNAHAENIKRLSGSIMTYREYRQA